MRYRVKSGKIHTRVNGNRVIYRPGDTFSMNPDDVQGFKDLLEQLEPDQPPPKPKAGLKAVHRGFGKYDVINEATGKKINDKVLTKEEAQELVETETDPELGKGPDLTKEPDLDVTDPVAGG